MVQLQIHRPEGLNFSRGQSLYILVAPSVVLRPVTALCVSLSVSVDRMTAAGNPGPAGTEAEVTD